MPSYQPATEPTLYFIGVSTGKSSIMRVFPAWAAHFGIDAAIRGIDFPLHAEPAAYREAVTFIKHDPLSRGALVTSHKIDLYRACRDLFDDIDPHALLMRETSCLSKRDDRLVCHAKDPISSGLALDGFIPHGHFAETGAELFSIGAGGSAIALTWHLMKKRPAGDRPSRIIVSDRNPHRLAEIRTVHAKFSSVIATEYLHAASASDNDSVLGRLPPGSVIVNATGLGKDAPGSPLTERAKFPQGGIAWDLNYRGNLVFLEQARLQKDEHGLQIEDGWSYFIHGWTQVIAEVFDIHIPSSGPRLNEISAIAIRASKA